MFPTLQKAAAIPIRLHAEKILRIESSINQASSHGRRDYAVLLLATKLGICSGDISSMTSRKLDFDRNLILLTQHKTGVSLELSMVPGVRSALEQYIQKERGSHASPYVFLCTVPPCSHISVQLVTKISSTAIEAPEIDPGGRKRGAHAFRSSLASSMVNDDTPYEAVRKVLGHTDLNAIRSYARLDVEHLRDYSLPVPDPSGSFAGFLKGR